LSSRWQVPLGYLIISHFDPLKSLWTTPFLHIHAKLKHVLINYLIKIHMHALFYFMKHYLLILIDGHSFVIIGIQAENEFE